MTAVLAALAAKVAALRALPAPEMRRAIRVAAGVSQQDIADELLVHRESVGRWERGERTPRGDLLVRYVALLDELR